MSEKNITISSNDKLTMIGNMATMLKAGIPILEIIDSLLESSKGNQRKILTVMHDDLYQGKHIYTSLEKFPKVFDKVSVNIIKASEEAGTLDVVLNDVRDGIQKDMEFGDKIRSALMYPMFIIVVFIAVLIMILIVVIPKITAVFSRLPVTLPLPTKIMMFVSNAMMTYTIPILIAIVTIGALIVYLYKQHRQLLFSFLFRLPVVSDLAAQIDLTRFSHSLSLLLNAGIPIITALELTESVVKKKQITIAITKARDTVFAGKKFSDGLKESPKVFPPLMVKLTEAGEKTGSLEKSMQDTANYLDYQTSKTLRTLTALLEPIMLVFVGILVGGMMLSIIAPIYNLIGQVGSR